MTLCLWRSWKALYQNNPALLWLNKCNAFWFGLGASVTHTSTGHLIYATGTFDPRDLHQGRSQAPVLIFWNILQRLWSKNTKQMCICMCATPIPTSWIRKNKTAPSLKIPGCRWYFQRISGLGSSYSGSGFRLLVQTQNFRHVICYQTKNEHELRREGREGGGQGLDQSRWSWTPWDADDPASWVKVWQSATH